MSYQHDPSRKAAEELTRSSLAGTVATNIVATFTAEVDVTANTFMSYVGNGSGGANVQPPNSEGSRCWGVALNDALAGETVRVCVSGFTQVLSGAAVSTFMALISDTSGKAKDAASAGQIVLGWSLGATAGADELVDVHLTGASGFAYAGGG